MKSKSAKSPGSETIFRGHGTVMPVWQLHRVDPGYIYVIEHHGQYKIGKTTCTAERLKVAKTWLPDMNLVGIKPFWGMSYHERCLHAGFSRYWYAGEWYKFDGDDDARDLLLEGFAAFTEDSPDLNSRDFIYWFNGEGMAEFLIEMDRQKISLRKLQKQEADGQKKA